jgi:DNA-binding response OmpR family regulator
VGDGAELDLTARALRRHGRLVRLRPMEFRLLEELARNPGRPVTREWLLRRVWGSHELDGSRTVDVHIRWLRAKVERDPENPEHLLTVRGVGYQLELGEESEAG